MFATAWKKLQDRFSHDTFARKGRKASSRRHGRRVGMEVLEPRVVLSVSNLAFALLQSDQVTVGTSDGSAIEQVTKGGGGVDKEAPRWSPDGTEITFWEENHQPSFELDLYSIAADGTNETLIRSFDGSDEAIPYRFQLDWSPDGSDLLFQDYDLFVWNRNTDQMYDLGLRQYSSSFRSPSFGPDLQPDTAGFQGMVAYSAIENSGGTGFRDIHVVELTTDDQGLLQTVGEPAVYELPEFDFEGFPIWSPDGSQIAFLEYSHEQGGNVLKIVDVSTTVDGVSFGTPQTLYGGSVWTAPTWSPDGAWIGFTTNEEPYDLYRIRPSPSRTDLTPVVQSKASEDFPDWNPQWVNDLDDSDNPASLSIDDLSVTEGDFGTVTADFTVSLSEAAGDEVTVDFATQDDTATTSDNDYDAASGTLTIPAGMTSGTISVTVNGDTQTEGDETFLVNLSSAVGATLADDQGVGTILGDDGTTTGRHMYVWDIAFDSRTRGNGKFHDERIATTVRSDSDGTAELTDDPLADAMVTLALSGPVSGTFSGTTDSSGVFRTDWLKNLPDGTYTAEVIDLTHASLTWNGALDPTANDADADGDGLPDQQHSIPHAQLAAASLSTEEGSTADSHDAHDRFFSTIGRDTTSADEDDDLLGKWSWQGRLAELGL